MFQKILIANRGEIAVRIMKTCQKLGIRTVAIYSEADENALHVKLANEAYLVGGPRVQESYLNLEKIIEIAKKTNAEAIHPGYGLLSENPSFPIRCKEEGIVFIGPSEEIITKMGSKIESRIAMQAADVPVVPGITTNIETAEEAIEIAKQIGYPLMLKASAGGGGIGMQLMETEQTLTKAFESNKTRAQNFFGNGEMYLERYIADAHHIEIQLLADTHGNTVYLWERECSVQRRNQKVIEEAPSPFLDEGIRKAMGEVAVQAAKALGYTNAGTVEFLVDDQKNFYFLEMNTRLQVEHPVTEEITGLDLVEQQLLIAYGEKLSFTQDDVKRSGHAIEARIYAEDPKTFFPSPGKITDLTLPTNIRIDHFLENQVTITPFYDPMIAKVIAHGETREEAISKLKIALEELKVEGIKTNTPMLLQVLGDDVFKSGIYTTGFVTKQLVKK
ncbi:acetyl-CoA carboxylase biotin carboxylase subunit [Bacillus sp. TH22]|uniref:acetyl-CoA carboxylase biotin carboxylase subunit n=1 Tax=unclassified Bacillus (in: firmicutes) TaxID=185979 RepID=UPI0019137EFE|nr:MULTISPECIES: acetyl-CoA carboxylase biotin carboxylase subunit [unclassified Bacillus (in: firmicutes)]MBK5360288.1 acetyl-CoA carboxylase biotin carboxylase subunit [Bacillus sp. TH44]MBK5346205.1 acetyl-CoA carboxylase biotin carboxylase subunit [Bacillus sp. TH45]MBK5362059.1 acetyl-CoA carboxylase biotin carboxylase subunit [Bacillus sp. TH50]MBK5447654.1 acetyl-CoA carboxylase biotin carboxylase subunit [Bacillus sp. TH22]MBK5453494.1 acetyl-CoA carboxylase biotin carboxylase subunit 